MKQRFLSLIYAAVAIGVSVCSGLADTVSFNLAPADGNVTGPAGASIGWGYSIENQSSTYWLVSSALSADSFAFGIPTLLFDFPILAPGASASEEYDGTANRGLYQLTWDTDAPDDFTNFGRFTLSSDWWSGNPLNGGVFAMVAPDAISSYTATVSESVTGTPEPSTLWLGLLAVVCVGVIRFKELIRSLRQLGIKIRPAL